MYGYALEPNQFQAMDSYGVLREPDGVFSRITSKVLLKNLLVNFKI